MANEKDIIRKGKRLAFLLRHDVGALEQGKIDEHGWRMVDELAGLGYSRELLDEIVASNNKQRYEYSADGKMIRARQGHSINVDVELAEDLAKSLGVKTEYVKTSWPTLMGEI